MPLIETDFKPVELLHEVLIMFKLPEVNNGLGLTERYPPAQKHLIIHADHDKIKQVLTIFVSNALKYTQKGYVEIGFIVRNHEIEFEVVDTGIGIPEKEHQLIFQNFYRGEHAIASAIGGTGLGLNIADQLVALLGGKIGVQSHPGQGSRFHFSIPLVTVENNSAEKQDIQDFTFEWKDATILIAEDEPDNYFLLETMLKGRVKKTDRAINGQEAVDKANNFRYDLVLMDMKMPVMDGLLATQHIKRKYPHLPVIAQTAYAQPEERANALRAGCDGYITKPIPKRNLLALMSKYLSKPGPSGK
jgi:CheY-like chemotaxis protein